MLEPTGDMVVRSGDLHESLSPVGDDLAASPVGVVAQAARVELAAGLARLATLDLLVLPAEYRVT